MPAAIGTILVLLVLSSSAYADGWKQHRHVSGATLSHPENWRVEDLPAGIALWPADANEAEMIVATGMASNGTTDPHAHEIGIYLDESMAQFLPGSRRVGEPQAIDAAQGAGALYRYLGVLPDGTRIASNVYVTIENGVALSLSALAPPEVLVTREKVLEGVFASLTMGASGASGSAPAPSAAGGSTNSDDPRLVGMFGGEALAGGGGTGVYVNTQLVYVLNADGSLYYGAQSHFNASQRDVDGNLKWTAGGSSDGSVDSGRWTASKGILTIQWDSGQRSVFAYGFEPDGSLVLRDPATRKLINFYSRIR